MATTSPMTGATNDVILNEIHHMRKDFEQFRAEHKQDKEDVNRRLRSVEDDRLVVRAIFALAGFVGFGTLLAIARMFLAATS